MEQLPSYPFHAGDDPLETLAIADPDLAEEIRFRLDRKRAKTDRCAVGRLVAETLDAMSQEIAFGQAVGRGVADLLGTVDEATVARYVRLIREAGQKGPTLGRLMALYLVPVFIRGGPSLADLFLKAVGIMLAKGTYTLKDPLDLMARLLDDGEIGSAEAYLELLAETFAQELTYNRCQHLTRQLPRTVQRMAPRKRLWQIRQLRRIVGHDMGLVEPFLTGMECGLARLDESALDRFVALALEKAGRHRALGETFMALGSAAGVHAVAQLQVAATLGRNRGPLSRYIKARTGLHMAVRPLADLPPSARRCLPEAAMVCSDRHAVYLCEEIDRFDSRAENDRLYKVLAKLEAGYHEFGTFAFDMEKAGLDRVPAIVPEPAGGDASELERFFARFPEPGLAEDLFVVFEEGRLLRRNAKRYPGIVRESLPMLRREFRRLHPEDRSENPVVALYEQIGLGRYRETDGTVGTACTAIQKIVDRFIRMEGAEGTAATSATLTLAAYRILAEQLPCGDGYAPLKTPFGRRPRPALVFASDLNRNRTARRLKAALARYGLRMFVADLLPCIRTDDGTVSPADLQALIRQHGGRDPMKPPPDATDPINPLLPEVTALLSPQKDTAVADDEPEAAVAWYPEWDAGLGDYLPDHVRVRERLPRGSGNGFYGEVLHRHAGLVRKIRYGFERMKPEGMVLLRRWIEGDAFDYRALLDFAIDKKIGRTPSERLYNKRIKQNRDVAVLLLLDLSRSTANTAAGDGAKSVLEVEKASLVLFCEALSVVGDAFAVAGFSGSGRLGVDYYRIKNFDDPVDDPVRDRIAALSPQRNTRMGAAIRHAAAQFATVPAKVRLLMILGDGFPNDTDYKRDHAVEDTRRAILEARAADIHTHAITVNMGADSRLDDIYGTVHHSVISDVRELPDKLPVIYGALTR